MLPYEEKTIDGAQFKLQQIDDKHYFYITGKSDDIFCDNHKYLKFLKGRTLKENVKNEIKHVMDNYDNVRPFYIILDYKEHQYNPVAIHNQSFQKMSKKEKAGLGIMTGGTASILISVFSYSPLTWVLVPISAITVIVGRKIQSLSKVARQLNSQKYMIK